MDVKRGLVRKTQELTQISPFMREAKHVIIMTSHSVGSHFHEDRSELPLSFLKQLQTDNYPGAKLYGHLEQPNTVTGVPAQALSWCQVFKVPAVAYILYTDCEQVDSITTEPLRQLVSKLPVKLPQKSLLKIFSLTTQGTSRQQELLGKSLQEIRSLPSQDLSESKSLQSKGLKGRPSIDQEPTFQGPSREQELSVPEPSIEQEPTILGPSREQEPTVPGLSREQEPTISRPSREQEPTVQGPSREQEPTIKNKIVIIQVCQIQLIYHAIEDEQEGMRGKQKQRKRHHMTERERERLEGRGMMEKHLDQKLSTEHEFLSSTYVTLFPGIPSDAWCLKLDSVSLRTQFIVRGGVIGDVLPQHSIIGRW
uniref:Proteasome assembly chaperone 1 n=1 Tax=Timema bartmani TaxID=61472 RepID=A0A7R9ETK6_9NEOP|nr:unnamed protein product [Timema bartmani]